MNFLKACMPTPLAFPFMKSTCQLCGWNDITQQRSDVLFLPHRCKDCGSDKLAHKIAGHFESFANNPLGVLRDLLR